MVNPDITDAIPYTLSNPSTTVIYTQNAEAFDVSINGQPFFIAASDETPYRRVTAQYRKQQYDQTREAGEQSLTGWWFRSQSSFHLGQGIKYFEPSQDESLRFQYTKSKGIDIWNKGQASLLYDTDSVHHTTGALKSNGRPNQHMRSIKWNQSGNTYEGILLQDEYDIDKIFPTKTATITTKALTSNVATITTSSAHNFAVGFVVTVSGVDATFNGNYTITSIPSSTSFTYAKTAANVTSTATTGTATSELEHFVDYNSGTDYPVYAMCDDGVYAYWITKITDSGVIKTAMYKRPIDSTAAATQMWKDSGVVVVDAVMEFTKERIVAAINNKVYEISASATALPSPVYTHPVSDFCYTSVTSSGAAIYLSGFSGSQSNIQKFTLTTAGAMPTLTSAITAAEMPVGELVYKIYYYLGFMMIGTNKGVRVAVVSDTDGSIAYGPLIFESEQPIYDFAARDRYVWCASNVDGIAGVTRIDLGNPITGLIFPYAWDCFYTNDSGRYTTACAFIDGTDRIAFCTNYLASNGAVYIESITRLVATGYLQTGYIRYNTLENKIFKFLTPRFNSTNGGLSISSIDPSGNEYSIGSFLQGATISEIGIPYPAGAYEYLGFKFTFTRNDDDSSKGPLFTGYQIKALPAVPRQRLIQYPLFCYDHETDHFGVEVGYDGAAYARMTALESTENAGDTVRVEDFRTGETYIGLIEEMDFINRTSSDKRFSGFGGYLLVTIRTI